MTQNELDAAVAIATGESVSEIQHRGFGIADPVEVAFDPDSVDLDRYLDWDDAERAQPRLFPR